MIILQKINKVKDISRMCVIFSAQLGNTDLQPDIQSQDGSEPVYTRKTVFETFKKKTTPSIEYVECGVVNRSYSLSKMYG